MPEPPELTEEQQAALQERLKNMSPAELQEFQKQQCIFCQIIAGKIPSKKIFEDEKTIAILDINPAAKGHLLLIPKEHYSIMPQIPDQELQHFFRVAKQLSHKLLQKLKAAGTSIFIANGLAAGQRAQHFMIHIIPRKNGDGLIPLDEKLQDKEMMQHIKNALQPVLNKQLGIEDQVKEPKEESPKEEKTEETKEEPIPNVEEKPKESAKETPKKEDEDVSLDDIANLFK